MLACTHWGLSCTRRMPCWGDPAPSHSSESSPINLKLQQGEAFNNDISEQMANVSMRGTCSTAAGNPHVKASRWSVILPQCRGVD